MPRRNDHVVEAGRLRAALGGVDGIAAATDDRLVEGVLREGVGARTPVEQLRVGLVVGEEKLRDAPVGADVVGQPILPHHGVARGELARPCLGNLWLLKALLADAAPAPGVAVPERWQGDEAGWLWPPVVDRHPDQDIVDRGLRVFDDHVKVAILGKHPGVEEFVLRLAVVAAAILSREIGVGKLALRILVECLAVGMGRRRVEKVIEFLDVFAVVALVAAEAEEPLLEQRVAAVPERQAETEPAEPVAEPQQPVFAPAVDAAVGVFEWKRRPCVSIGRVVFANGAPLTGRQIGAPQFPEPLSA